MKKTLILSLIIAMIFSATTMPLTVRAASQVSYEKGWTIWYAFPSGSLSNYSMGASVVRNMSYEGNAALRMYFDYSETPNLYISLQKTISASSLEPNTSYTFKYYVRTNNVFVARSFYTIAGNARVESQIVAWDTHGIKDWTAIYIEFTTESTTKDVLLSMELSGANNNASEMWVDGATFYKTDTNQEIEIENGGFEYVDITAPGEVSNVETRAENLEVVITWTDPSDDDFENCTLYQVSGDTKTKIKSIAKGVQSYTLENLVIEQEYTFLITTEDKLNNCSEGVSINVILVIPPEAPNVSTDDVNDKIIGIDETMEFKIDIGDWQEYTEGMDLDLSGDHIVWVRVKSVGICPFSKNTIIVFKKYIKSFEATPVQFTYINLKNDLFKIRGYIEVNKAIEISLVMKKENTDPRDYGSYMFAKQLTTNADGTFEFEVNMIGTKSGTDMSGGYIITANSLNGLKSNGYKVSYANKAKRLLAIEALNNCTSPSEIASVISVDSQYYSAFVTMNINVESYTNNTKIQKYINEALADKVRMKAFDTEYESEFSIYFRTYYSIAMINEAIDTKTVQYIIVNNSDLLSLEYKGESFNQSLINGKENLVNWLLERLMENDYQTLEDLQDYYDIYSALYNINYASYSLMKKVISDNIAALGMENDSTYINYINISSYESANKYIASNAYPDKIRTVDNFRKCLEGAIDVANNSPSTTFKGDDRGGRDEGKTTSSIVMDSEMLITQNNNAVEIVNEIKFNDLGNAQWATEAIGYLSDKKVLEGDGKGKFYPDKNVTREEFVKMLICSFSLQNSEHSMVFEDVDMLEWYAPYISVASSLFIVNGLSETRFGVGAEITREDMATLLQRTLKYKNILLNKKEDRENFRDAEYISQYAIESIGELYNAGIINGIDNNNFEPQSKATRAQCAQIIYKVLVAGGLK